MTKRENPAGCSLEALNSEIASTEMSIALLASQSSGTTCMMVPATPPKLTKKSDPSAPTSTGDEPLTPTANLKMLVSAASPAIRDRESKKRELFTEPEQTSPSPCVVPSFALPMFDSKVVYRNGNFMHVNLRDGSESEKMVISRKDKSLGLLCQR
jgi:transcription factor E2F7/8